MKKVFLIVGMAGFTSVSAQQKDVFDIDSHLQKRRSEKTKVFNNKSLIFPLRTQNVILQNSITLSPTYTLSNGDKVYQSPAYNMPVIITDTRTLKAMPNAGLDEQMVSSAMNKLVPGKIPNASPPLFIQQ